VKLCIHFYICLHGIHKDDLSCTLLKEEISKEVKNLKFRFCVAQTLYNLVAGKTVEIEVLIVW
jgi:hypothetical protein